MERVWKIDVPGNQGYSFAIKGEIEDELEAIYQASENDAFEDKHDARYATAEEITDDEDALNAFKNCTITI